MVSVITSEQQNEFSYFWPIFLFYTPLKTPENKRFCGALYKMQTFARNGFLKVH